MYELYLNRLIDDEEHSKEFLQELRNNSQLVTFLWEDSNYPFKDKLIEIAKMAYEENRICEIYTSVKAAKNHWERPWERMKCSEYSFKMRLGMHGYWIKWVKTSSIKAALLVLGAYTVILFVMFLILSIAVSSDSVFLLMIAMEFWLLSTLAIALIHPIFLENMELTAICDIALILLYDWSSNKFDSGTSIILTLFAFIVIYSILTNRERKKLSEYRPYIGYYYFH